MSSYAALALALSLAAAPETPVTSATSANLNAASVEKKLVEKHGNSHSARIHTAVSQAAALWRASDGDAKAFEAFCLEHFLVDEKLRADTFARFEAMMEQLDGHFLEIYRELKKPTDL